uniref:Uncharacterized protein n=1 Tax=Buteo japonicus TaxID=224669 RepID=A0A8B9ZBD2_9AVES
MLWGSSGLTRGCYRAALGSPGMLWGSFGLLGDALGQLWAHQGDAVGQFGALWGLVIEDDRIDDVLQNLSEKAPPGV